VAGRKGDPRNIKPSVAFNAKRKVEEKKKKKN